MGYRLTLIARSHATMAALADELRSAGTDVTVITADAGDPDRLHAAAALLFARPGAPGVVIYSAAFMASDDLLTVAPEQLASARRYSRPNLTRPAAAECSSSRVTTPMRSPR